MNLLKINHLYKTYPQQSEPAVRNITLNVKAGEILGLVGESGSGKTTLLRLIAGLEDGDEGSIRLKKELVTGPAHHLVPGHPQIRLVHQDFKLSPNVTVRENIAYSLRSYATDYSKNRLEAMIELCELASLQHKLPKQLSGGEMQRVALARALADEPVLLLLDEPFSNVDAIRRQELKYQLRDIIRRSGTTAIFVTHDTAEALTLSDSLAVMYQGQIIQTGTSREVYQHPVNPYVARFFGYVNIQKMSQLSALLQNADLPFLPADLLCIRAECIHLCQAYEADFTGTVKQVRYMGFYELWEIAISETITWQVLQFEKILFSSEVFLKVDWHKVHVFAAE